ncbi:MAG: metallophosphoesterase [Helicobacter sp.]|uniref:metallophosphoesterase n=1 Tax=Helicobacter sp. TaxID=218 RepID=UPI0025C4851A|nr:metallophosphoesterase [Helicobacter sp.]MCH5313068.1 metallophosphoesterase [Helicobacter sp.]
MNFHITEDTFLISDSHFGHKAVLKKEPSRLQFAEAHQYKDFYALHRDLWNQAVRKKDNVLHLGDLYFSGGFSYLKKLKGTKMLIVGNNDIEGFERLKTLKNWYVQQGLKLNIEQKESIIKKLDKEFGKTKIKEDIYLNAIVQDIAGERIMFSHFPVFNRKHNDRFSATRDILDKLFKLADCSLNIHGHIHSRQTGHSFCFNVCCEQLGFAPKRLGEILKLWRYIHI